jgi:hypothetical protein
MATRRIHGTHPHPHPQSHPHPRRHLRHRTKYFVISRYTARRTTTSTRSFCAISLRPPRSSRDTPSSCQSFWRPSTSSGSCRPLRWCSSCHAMEWPASAQSKSGSRSKSQKRGRTWNRCVRGRLRYGVPIRPAPLRRLLIPRPGQTPRSKLQIGDCYKGERDCGSCQPKAARGLPSHTMRGVWRPTRPPKRALHVQALLPSAVSRRGPGACARIRVRDLISSDFPAVCDRASAPYPRPHKPDL